MFFRSLSSFRLTRLVSLFAACLGLTVISGFAQPTFFSVRSTPYDRQMIPISRVLNFPAGRFAGPTSLTMVNQWMFNLHAIPYQYSSQWKTPAEINSDLVADCKGKAVMLYARMRANGMTHVRFIIGKHHLADLQTHAWLEWDTAGGTFLLDPTFNWMIEPAGERDPATYIPLYAYDGSRKYRAGYPRTRYATVLARN